MTTLSEKLERLADCSRLAAYTDAERRASGGWGPANGRMYSVHMSSALEAHRDIEAEFKRLSEENVRLHEMIALERTLREQTMEQRNRMIYLLEEKCLRLEEQISGVRFELESRK